MSKSHKNEISNQKRTKCIAKVRLLVQIRVKKKILFSHKKLGVGHKFDLELQKM